MMGRCELLYLKSGHQDEHECWSAKPNEGQINEGNNLYHQQFEFALMLRVRCGESVSCWELRNPLD